MKLAEMTDGMQCRWSGMLSLEPAPRVNIERLTVTSRNHNNYDSAIRRASRANWVTGLKSATSPSSRGWTTTLTFSTILRCKGWI